MNNIRNLLINLGYEIQIDQKNRLFAKHSSKLIDKYIDITKRGRYFLVVDIVIDGMAKTSTREFSSYKDVIIAINKV